MGINTYPTPATSSVPNWTLLGRTTSSAGSYSFTGLGGYRQLKVNCGGFATSTNSVIMCMQFNSDGTSLYGNNYVGYLQATTPFSSYAYPADPFYRITGLANSNATNAGPFYVLIDRANATDSAKTMSCESSYSTGSGLQQYVRSVGTYNSTTPITSISIFGNPSTTSWNLASYNSFIEVWGAN